MPRNLSDSFFGSIALKNRMLTRDQLTQALRVQWERIRGEAGPTLGEVCRMLGFLSEEQVNAVVRAQAKSEVLLGEALIGQICLRNGLVTAAQLEEALEDQRALDYTVRLGDLLCMRGFLDRQELHAVLAMQRRLHATKVRPVIVPPAKGASKNGRARPTIERAARSAEAPPAGAKKSGKNKTAAKKEASTRAKKAPSPPCLVKSGAAKKPAKKKRR